MENTIVNLTIFLLSIFVMLFTYNYISNCITFYENNILNSDESKIEKITYTFNTMTTNVLEEKMMN